MDLTKRTIHWDHWLWGGLVTKAEVTAGVVAGVHAGVRGCGGGEGGAGAAGPAGQRRRGEHRIGRVLGKVGMEQRLLGSDPLGRVEMKHFLQREILDISSQVRLLWECLLQMFPWNLVQNTLTHSQPRVVRITGIKSLCKSAGLQPLKYFKENVCLNYNYIRVQKTVWGRRQLGKILALMRVPEIFCSKIFWRSGCRHAESEKENCKNCSWTLKHLQFFLWCEDAGGLKSLHQKTRVASIGNCDPYLFYLWILYFVELCWSLFLA